MMDEGTIGPKKCEISLNKILIGLEKKFGKDAKKVIRRITNLYHKFREGLKHLQEINDINFFYSMTNLFKDDTVKKIEVNREKYEKILGEENATVLLSHFCCVIACFREAKREKREK
jgi:hypothetical protein